MGSAACEQQMWQLTYSKPVCIESKHANRDLQLKAAGKGRQKVNPGDAQSSNQVLAALS